MAARLRPCAAFFLGVLMPVAGATVPRGEPSLENGRKSGDFPGDPFMSDKARLSDMIGGIAQRRLGAKNLVKSAGVI